MDDIQSVKIRRTTLEAIRGMVRGVQQQEVGLTIKHRDYRVISISILPRPAGAEAVPLLYVKEVEA